MNLELNQQGKKHARVGMGHGNMQMPGIPEFVQGGGSGTVEFDVAPQAMQFMRDPNQNSPLHQGARSEPTSSDMIPAVKGLSNLQVSFGSGSDVSMTPADSVLGKRMAEGNDEPVHSNPDFLRTLWRQDPIYSRRHSASASRLVRHFCKKIP
jgi:hypothetical protein